MKPVYAILIVVLFCQMLFAAEEKEVLLFPDHHLCLEATGRVILKADKAVFSFNVSGYGPSLRDAVTQANTKVADCTAALNRLGIGNDSFATGSFASGKSLDASFWSDKKDYSASLITTVTLRDLTKLDDAILILTDRKVNSVSSINYSLDNQAQARQQARELAFNRIVEQRNTITNILGVAITDVQLIDEAPFDQLPWGTLYAGYSKGMNLGSISSNSVSFYDKSEAEMDMRENSGGLYTPDVTVETQVRVIYRIGLQEKKP